MRSARDDALERRQGDGLGARGPFAEADIERGGVTSARSRCSTLDLTLQL
jgi:hypothetical protein